MERREAPPTREGWYALHDLRRVDWDAWRGAPTRERDRAVAEGRAYLESVEGVEDAEEGASVAFGILGHEADLLVLHLRPTMEDVDALSRRFEGTALAEFTERAFSYVSVTEVSGYTTDAREFFEGGEVEDVGLGNYLETRLHPTIPDAGYVCFYPMSKRRGPDHNWYDLPLEERAEHMKAHGEIGREYAGAVTQVITGSIGFDDWEWGVTLFSNDPTRFKDLLYEMRFDPSTSWFAEFGPFFAGTRLEPARLGGFLSGEHLDEDRIEAGSGTPHESRDSYDPHHPHEHGESSGASPHADVGVRDEGDADDGAGEGSGGGGIRGELADLDVYAGRPHGEDVYAMVLYSEADPDELFEAVEGLRGNFDHYDTHVKTAVYADEDGDRPAVVSLWETQSAAETAGGFLADLPDVVARAGEGEGEGEGEGTEGFGTMGMFYTVKPEYREDFHEKFATVGDLLDEMEGHRDTRLLANYEDENDMFIDSRWASKDDAMAFFRSEAFRDAVDWGRDVLADRPRHVFLA